MRRLRQLAACALTTALACALPAQRAHKVELPPGPLLTFATASGGEPHEMTVHVVGCDSDGDAVEPQIVWVNRGNVKVLRRLDRHRLLIQSFGEPYALLVVDAAAGTHRVLCEGGELVGVHGEDVLYLGDNRWGKGDNLLYARSWVEEGEATPLCERAFLSVPIVAGNLAIGVTAGEQEVWAVSLVRRRGRRLYALPTPAMQPKLALSPSGARLAIGAAPDWRGRLVVVDVGAAEIVREWSDLPLDLSPLSSFTPTLEVGWHDEQHVVCSESRGDPLRGGGEFVFVRRSLATGDVTEEEPYGPIELYHRSPPPPGPPAPPPAFTVEREGPTERLLRRGREQPLCEFDWREHPHRLRISPDGRYVTERARGQKSFVLHREGKPPLEVVNSGGYQFVWLPAAPQAREK